MRELDKLGELFLNHTKQLRLIIVDAHDHSCYVALTQSSETFIVFDRMLSAFSDRWHKLVSQ